MEYDFIALNPKENKVRLFRFEDNGKFKEFSEKTLVIKKNVEAVSDGESVIFLPSEGMKFSCKIDEEKIICEMKKNR